MVAQEAVVQEMHAMALVGFASILVPSTAIDRHTSPPHGRTSRGLLRHCASDDHVLSIGYHWTTASLMPVSFQRYLGTSSRSHVAAVC